MDEAIPTRVGACAEPLRALDAVVMVEGVVAELAKRNDPARLAERSKDQAGRVRRSVSDEARIRNTFHPRCVPTAIGQPGEDAEFWQEGDWIRRGVIESRTAWSPAVISRASISM